MNPTVVLRTDSHAIGVEELNSERTVCWDLYVEGASGQRNLGKNLGANVSAESDRRRRFFICGAR